MFYFFVTSAVVMEEHARRGGSLNLCYIKLSERSPKRVDNIYKKKKLIDLYKK